MSALPPAVAAVRLAVRDTLRAAPPGGVLVACSGGADSLALAAAVAFVAPREGRPAGLVTVDHGLQPGSADRAAAVADWGRKLGFDPAEAVAVQVAGRPGGPEAAARDARYEALVAAAHRHGAAAVLLGHTLDDQAETVLLALARGAGPRGLSGMPARRDAAGVALLRPLLTVGRTATRAACAAAGLTPWEDPHNDDPGYARARVRASALPALIEALGPAVVDNLARTARLLAEDASTLDRLAADALDACRARTGGTTDVVGVGSATVEARPPSTAAEEGVRVSLEGGTGEQPAGAGGPLVVPALRRLEPAVRARVLHAWCRELGAPGAALSHRHVAALDALVTRWHGQGTASLPGGIGVARRGDFILRVL